MESKIRTHRKYRTATLNLSRLSMLVFCSFCCLNVYGQSPQLLLDLNLEPASGAPDLTNVITEFKERLIFMADDGLHGQEYWSFNIQKGTVSIISDLVPGLGDGVDLSQVNDEHHFVFNEKLYLVGKTEEEGREPLCTDGRNTMNIVKDITLGPESSDPLFKISFNNNLYFTAEQNGDRELYKIDFLNKVDLVANLNLNFSSSPVAFATTSKDEEMSFLATVGDDEGCALYRLTPSNLNPQFVTAINTECGCNSTNQSIYVGDSLLVFTAKDALVGRELWGLRTGESVPFLLSDINPSGNSNPDDFYIYDDILFFSADGGSGIGRELYKSDGTPSGTTLIKNIAFSSFGSNPKEYTEFDGELFFLAEGDLYKSDGTEVGTVKIADVPSGAELIASSTLMYIGANELWASDGTTDGTLQLVEIYPGEESSAPKNLVVKDDIVYFFATDDLHAREFYKNEGIAISELIKDINIGTEDFFGEYIAYDNYLYLSKSNADSMIWRSDGTIGNLEPFFNHGQVRFRPLVVKDGILFFLTGNTMNPSIKSLWKTDGTVAGTTLLTHPDSIFSFSSIVEHYRDFYISGRINSTRVLLKYDKVSDSMVEVLKGDGLDRNYAFLGDDLYYAFDDGILGSELYKNGSLLKDINLTGGSFPGLVNSFTVVGDKLFFAALAEVSGIELYVTDGTSAGTTLVKDISPNINESSSFSGFYRFKNMLATQVTGGSTGIWLSNGTDMGTFAISEFGGATADVPFTEFNGELLFRGHDDINGTELWKSDGTVSGSSLFKKLNSTSERGFPRSFYQFNNVMYFFGSGDRAFFDGVRYLWRSDGTTAGTFKVSESIQVGVRPMHVLNDKLFFRASNGLSGYEIFYIQTCAGSITPPCLNGPCEVRSQYESSDQITLNGDQKVYGLEKARLDASLGTEIKGEFEVDKYGQLEVYTDGCNN